MDRRNTAWSRVLRHAVLTGIILALPAALAQSPQPPPADQTPAQRAAALEAKATRNHQRADALKPARRDAPARSSSLSDDELADIRSAVAEVLPGAQVTAGTVVTGCPCEDSDFCSDQVWVTASGPDGSHGLLLSKVVNQWKVGSVQGWWLDYETLQSRRARYSPQDYRELENEIYARFPSCSPPLMKADATATPQP